MKNLVKVEGAAVDTKNGLLDSALISRFLRFAAVSPNTEVTYKKSLKQLAKHFADNEIEKPARADLENWRDSLIDSGKSASTIQLYLSACKLFFRWLAQEGIFPNIADNLKSRVRISNNHKKDALTLKQANNLLKAASKGTSLKALRLKAVIALKITTGLRDIEIVRADICDIRQIDGRNFLYTQCKGHYSKDEMVEIAPAVMKAINAYLKAREKAAGKKLGRREPLFVSTARRNKNCRLQTQTISREIKAALRSICIDTSTITSHSLRHTAACLMIQQGVSIENVKMCLHHRQLQTTLIYLNVINRINNRAEITIAQVLRI